MIRTAIVGLGKIARTQHIPALAASPAFELVAAVDPVANGEEVPVFPDLAALLREGPAIDAIAMCQPPGPRRAAAIEAVSAGKHVLLEKPPAATVAEAEAVVAAAADAGTTLFAAWHSRFAVGVAPAAAWLRDTVVERVEISWMEDVRVWHPGQTWIWREDGFGVFDPGINALSILTALLPGSALRAARLACPANQPSPIAADLQLELGSGAPVHAVFDFRQQGPQTWDIRIQTDRGTCLLSEGGGLLAIDGRRQPVEDEGEYPALYRRFAELVHSGTSDVDLAPLALVENALLSGGRDEVEPFFP